MNDVNDLCSNTAENDVVDTNGCSQIQLDVDDDGYNNTQDDFASDPTQWMDSDGDGYGDNWGDSNWNDSRLSEWTGIYIIGASQPDYCPDTAGNSTADGYFGCLDADGNGIADLFEQDGTNGTDNTNQTQAPLDTDGDGVSDLEDNCPGTSPNTPVDSFGCEIVGSQSDEDEPTSAFDSFFSGDSDPVTTTVGIGAILLALFTLLQTNAVAAVLPDTFRWVQVLRRNSKLSKEERNELTYLQSIVQAYHSNPEELVEELNQLKSDLTGRYTNNEIKKETREKLFTLIEDLLSSSSGELYRVAHSDAYFGLAGAIDSEDRSKLLEEKIAMSDEFDSFSSNQSTHYSPQQTTISEPPVNAVGAVHDDGYEWYEWPQNSDSWWYRDANSNKLWKQWDE